MLRYKIIIFKYKYTHSYLDAHPNTRSYLGLNARKPVFSGLRITQAQTSLRIRTDYSAPLLFAFLESIIYRLATSEISNFYKISVAEETGLSLLFSMQGTTEFQSGGGQLIDSSMEKCTYTDVIQMTVMIVEMVNGTELRCVARDRTSKQLMSSSLSGPLLVQAAGTCIGLFPVYIFMLL